MIEILAGDGIENAFAALGIKAKNIYKRQMPPKVDSRFPRYYGEAYEVWELAETDFDRLNNIDDENWPDEWGWWRYSEGSNMGYVGDCFIIKGTKIRAWNGYERKKLFEDWQNEPEEVKKEFKNFWEYEKFHMLRKYPDLLLYLCEELGASTESNVCALAVDLAMQNRMTLGELFTKLL